MNQDKNTNTPADEEFSDRIISLEDEDGSEEQFELLEIIDYEDHDYAVMVSLEQPDDAEEEVMICEILPGPDEDTDYYAPVESDAILEAVYDIFRQRASDDFDFAD